MNVGGFTLRPHQIRAFNEARAEVMRLLAAGIPPRVVIVAPCGAGKTVMSSALIAGALQKDRTSLFMASGRTLIDQKSATLHKAGISHAVLMSEQDDKYYHSAVLVASKDTYAARALHAGRISKEHRDLWIIDEGHRSLGPEWMQILPQDDKTVVVMFTATPALTNGKGMGSYCKGMVRAATYEELIASKLLVPCRVFAPWSIDTTGLKVGGEGDWSWKAAEKRFNQKVITGNIVETWKNLGDGKPTVCFAQGVKHSLGLRDEFNASGIPSAHVDADTHDDERKEIFRQLRDGNLKVVTNFGVLCLDEKTEILTSDGFVGIDDMTYDHKVANWESGRIYFDNPKFIVRRDRLPGERMVSLINQKTSIRVTEDHWMVCTKDGFSCFKMKARDVVGKRWRLPACGEADPFVCEVEQQAACTSKERAVLVAKTAYNIRASSGLGLVESRSEADRRVSRKEGLRRLRPEQLSRDHCRFIGFWIGDGTIGRSTGGGTKCRFAQSTAYPEIIKWFDNLLLGLGYEHSRTRSHYDSCHNPVITWQVCRGTGGGVQERSGYFEIEHFLSKSGTELLWGLSGQQLWWLLEGYWFADGEHGNAASAPGESLRICGARLDIFNLLQAIAVCRGFKCSISGSGLPQKNGTLPLWDLNVNRAVPLLHISHKEQLQFEEAWKAERVWCVTSTSGNIITRRQGKVVVTGNTTGWDEPCVQCGILAFATDSLVKYLQVAGRVLRPFPGKDEALIIDHGDNVRRHGWPTADHDWSLDPEEKIQEREFKAREKSNQREPICCPKCGAMRESGPKCINCGHQHAKTGTKIINQAGELIEIKPTKVKKQSDSDQLQRTWMTCLAIAAQKGSNFYAAKMIFASKTRKQADGMKPMPASHQMMMPVGTVYPGFIRKRKSKF